MTTYLVIRNDRVTFIGPLQIAHAYSDAYGGVVIAVAGIVTRTGEIVPINYDKPVGETPGTDEGVPAVAFESITRGEPGEPGD